MKKTIFALFIICLSLILPAKTILIKGDYKNFCGENFSLNWKAVRNGENIKLFLNGKVKATLTIKNGKVVKITEIKRVAGKEKIFTVTSPSKINLELKSNFYPFSLILNFLNGKKATEEKKGNTVFKITGVKE